jgi:uncharacterized membrane protein
MKEGLLYVMALLYVAAGIYHFVNPRFYMKIMPPAVPYHKAVVDISGVLEIIFGLMLLFDATRHTAAWFIIFLLIAIFPANVYMAVNWTRKRYRNLWIAYARLPLQGVLIYWAWVYT